MVPRNEAAAASSSERANPRIDQFLFYAERSIRIGCYSHARDGDVGVRTPTAPGQGRPQLLAEKHATCCDLFAPSIALEMYCEVRDVWTNALTRNEDIGIRAEDAFPAGMPPLPLALASGSGTDITVPRETQRSLIPGTYGMVTLLYKSELWLAAGTYTFAGVKMDECSKLLADPGVVDVRIVGRLWTDREAKIASQAHCPEARHFTIAVAGGDEHSRGDGGTDAAIAQSGNAIPAVVIGAEAYVHALLCAPHGTVLIEDGACLKGAFAGFDIRVREQVDAEFQNGFPVSPPGQQGSQQLSGYFGVHPDPSVAPLVGPVPADTNISLAFGLPVRDPQGLATFIQEVSDPKNPVFRKHLTQAQFTATYGATSSDYQSLQNWATGNGFTIKGIYSNNLLLGVSATARQIENALFVNLVYRQRADGSNFVAVDREPSLDLAVPILEINGLTDFRLPTSVGVAGTGGGGSLYRAADLRNAYLGVGSALQSLDGSGQVVGIVGFATYNQSDITGYDALQRAVVGQPSLPPTNVTIVATEGGNPGANSQVEATADVELVYAMAPNAKILFFQGSSGITGHLDDILHNMATSNPPLTIASCSLGFGRSDNSQQALDQMAANGVSFFTASGDFGDIGDPQGNLDMNNQTLVGGTLLATNALSTGLPNPVYPANYYAGETTWNKSTAPKGFGVTGGGIMNGNNQNNNCYCWPHGSCCGSGVPIPSYQLGMMQFSAAANGGSQSWRNYPDVAMCAANIEIFFNGATTGWTGTSAAAPLWAGFMALVNQRIKINNPSAGLAGFINTTLYDLGLTTGLTDDLYAACFNDISDNVSNANGFGSGFKSVAGYDLCTGLGSPKPGLIYQLSSSTPLTSNQPLEDIRFVIGTGGDNLRGNGGFGSGCQGTGCTADILFPGYDLATGVAVKTVTLKPTGGDAEFANNSTTPPMDFRLDTDNAGNKLPVLTPSQGIVGVRINIQESYEAPCTADNWDITTLSVSLFIPPYSASTAVCQLNLVGTAKLQDGNIGLVRLSESAGSSGNGPSSPIYFTGAGSGCP